METSNAKSQKKKRYSLTSILSIVLNGLLITALGLSAFWVFDYKKSKDGEIARLNEIIRLTNENNIIIPIFDFKEYVTRYGNIAQFAQRYFPDELVYPGYGGIKFIPLDESLKKGNIKGEKIVYEGSRAYYQDGNYQALLGIDVSTHQRSINWEKVKNDGIEFAMIRVGFRGYTVGKIYLDDTFNQNIAGANEVGIPVGVYFFSGAINQQEAIQEAEFVLRQIKDYKVDLAIAFDMEDISAENNRMKNLTTAEKTAIALAFCQRIEAAGYKAVVYGNAKWLLESLTYSEVAKYGIWYANWNYLHWPYELYAYQYTSSGTVDGINGRVDMNLGFFNYGE